MAQTTRTARQDDDSEITSADAGDEAGAIGTAFRSEARQLIWEMRDALDGLAVDLDDGTGFDIVASRGHTLSGSAAIADQGTLSHAGRILERVAELARSMAQVNRNAAHELVAATRHALDPIERMIDAPHDGTSLSASAAAEQALAHLLQALPADESQSLLADLDLARDDDAALDDDPALDDSRDDLDEGSLAFDESVSLGLDAGPDASSATSDEMNSIFADEIESPDADEIDDPLASVDPELAAQLAETFAEELHEVLFDVQDRLSTLVDPAEQLDACAELGRMFHTIKGSAATVGRTDLRAPARQLQDLVGEVEDDSTLLPLSLDFIVRMEEPLGQIFLAAGLEPPSEILSLVAAAASAVSQSVVSPNLERPDEDAGHSDSSRQAAEPSAELLASESITQTRSRPAEQASQALPASDVPPEIVEAFHLDAKEALSACEEAIFALEKDASDRDALRLLFRQFHTLKGAASAVGLDRITGQLHAGETMLEGILDGTFKPRAQAVVDFLLPLVDSVEGLIQDSRGRSHSHRILDDVESMVAALVADSPPTEPEVRASKTKESRSAKTSPSAAGARSAVETSSIERAAVTRQTAPAPKTDATSTLAPRPSARETSPQATGAAPSPPAKRAQATAESESGVVRIHAGRLDFLMNRVSELIVSRTRINDTVSDILDRKDKLGVSRARLNELIDGFRNGFEFNARRQTSESDGATSSTATSSGDFSDLEFEKYDDFNVLAGSAVELAADASAIIEQLGQLIEVLSDETRQVSKVSSSLQRAVTQMRLLDFDSLYKRLQRPVRDAARSAGKSVDLRLRGGDVKLDRGLLDSMYAPLLHIVRNAVSHGIESPEVRQERAKPEAGVIEIIAEQQTGRLVICVEDNGGGLDFAAIQRKGIEAGLLRLDDAPSRDRLTQLIFAPGFSTHGKVDLLSGRGVGMDVVKLAIDELHGRLQVDSRDGLGMTIRISIPVTSAIEQVLVLRAGEQRFAVVQSAIESVIHIDADQISDGLHGKVVRVGEASVDLLSLDALAGAPMPASATAVLLRCDDRRIALIADRVETQREAVIRPLSRFFAGHPLFTSATFASDGQVIFVLDLGRLLGLLNEGKLAALSAEFTRTALLESDTRAQGAAIEATVLWADDSISVRSLAQHFLRAEGISVLTAVDGHDALDKLRTGRFQVVVTDLEMPRMHGYQLLEQMRSDPALRAIPVIVCSSRSSEKHRRRAREAGAQGYLTKPFSKEGVASAIRQCLDGDGQPATPGTL